MFERPVIRSFAFRVETASRQLPHIEMITQAVATDSLALAWLIGATAVFHICCFLAFHGFYLLIFTQMEMSAEIVSALPDKNSIHLSQATVSFFFQPLFS
jgi:hypothetical protein